MKKEEQLEMPIGNGKIPFSKYAISEEVLECLETFKLKRMKENFKEWVESVGGEDEFRAFAQPLCLWLAEERIHRQEAAIAGKIRSAKFRRLQTIDAFNFKFSKATEKVEKPYRALYQTIAREALPSAVFTGTAGQGKTHLARALGYGACQKGLSVLFVPCAEMVNHLEHAQKTFTLESELNKYRRPHVLIIDELGYVSLDTQASNLFFQVISARHDAGLGTIATTNLPFGKFNQIFANDAIARAIVDRLVNTAEIFFLDGELSFREWERQQKAEKQRKKSA